MNYLTNFYDKLCDMSLKCVKKIDYKDIPELKNILIISVIEEARVRTFVEGLKSCFPNINIIIVVQNYVYEGFCKSFGEECKIISWNGSYTLSLIDRVSELIDVRLLEAMAFFSDFPVNIRDKNFLEIYSVIKAKSNLRLYSNVIGNELFEVINVEILQQIIRVYEETAKLLEIILEEEDNEYRNFVAD